MSNHLKISIVTPSFNQGQFVGSTVRSVLEQDYPKLEYIFMDGGSTDSTIDAVDKYRDKFFHFRSHRDEGQAAAIAEGLETSSGDILAYLNSDDMLAPQALFYVDAFFRNNPDIDVLYSHRLAIDTNGVAIYYWILPTHSSYLMSRWDYIPQETTFWRRSIWERAGNIDKSFRFAMDYDLFVRFMKLGKFKRVNRFLGAYRWHDDAKSSRLFETVGREEIARVWREHGIQKSKISEFLERRFHQAIDSNSNIFAQDRYVLSGCLPGLGYHINDVWGW
jgi:glycosyltransferase involved in cell wall biosynthesis